MATIGFIGLGNMGGPMAANLLKAGHDVTVFDLVPEAVAELVALGAASGATASETVSNADVVISMLPAAQHVLSLYLGDQGIASAMNQGTLVIDCSTIDAASAQTLGKELAQQGFDFVDAPVSGGVAGSKAGTLTFIMGGSTEAVERAKPVLSAMGQNLFHAGDTGAGQIAKICNNMLLAVLMAGTSEALQLAIAHGLDPKVVSEIMQQSSGNNWTLQKYNPCPGVMEGVPSSNDYQGGFMVQLMNKDLNLAMSAAQQSSSATPMAAAAQSLYRLHQSQGNDKRDFSSIFEMFGPQNR